jgi:predicted acylesterase/phospholipase RssA
LFALAAAFRIDLDVLEEAYHKYFGIDTFLPHTTFENFQRIFETKGIMSTDAIVRQIVDAFLFAGVDIRDKTMDDAPQKLSFLSSDMTAQRPALLTGKVPIVNAFACSICVPFVFRPEILYGHVHLDGGVFTRCMADVVSPETLVVHVSGIGRQITETSSLSDICTALYGGHRSQYFRKNVVRIAPPPINFLDEVTREQKMEMAKSGYLQTRAFLAKRLAEEHE